MGNKFSASVALKAIASLNRSLNVVPVDVRYHLEHAIEALKGMSELTPTTKALSVVVPSSKAAAGRSSTLLEKVDKVPVEDLDVFKMLERLNKAQKELQEVIKQKADSQQRDT